MVTKSTGHHLSVATLRYMMGDMASTKTKGATKKPNRTQPVQLNARLTLDEKADLDALLGARGFSDWLRALISQRADILAVVAAFNAARDLPPGTLDFAEWIRAIVFEKKKELEAKVKPKR